MRDSLLLQSARLLGAVARLTGRGGGTALPGLLVERAAPDLIPHLAARLDAGAAVVSGTNGKTTTTRLIAESLTLAGYRVVNNRSGSNLMRGIAAALTNTASGPSRPKSDSGDATGQPTLIPHTSHLVPPSIGLFEVDEAALPLAVVALRPRVMVLLNLFRDQLDRYGEVDTIARLWRETIATLPATCTVALNADDPLVASLGRSIVGRVIYFGFDDVSHAAGERERAADFVECLDCGVPYHYSLTYYGHLGHYACPCCGWSRPTPSLVVKESELRGIEGARTVIQGPEATVTLEWSLPGLYNQYNLVAAAAALAALGLPLSLLERTAKTFQAAFGRAERFSIDGKEAVLLLAKNPVGANQVIRLLQSIPGRKAMLLALNDLAADGEDVSWIWDADLEGLQDQVRWAVISGRRAEDLALRLKYAGCWGGAALSPLAGESRRGGEPLIILKDLDHALQTAIYRLEPGETLYIIPTYTAMLELRRVLNRMGVLPPFWDRG